VRDTLPNWDRRTVANGKTETGQHLVLVAESREKSHVKVVQAGWIELKLNSLAQRIFLVTALALAPAVAIVIYNAVTLRDSRTAELHTEALRSAELAALELERIISGTDSIMTVMANSPVVARRDREECSAFLERIVTALPFLSSISIIGPDGTVWCMPERPDTALYVGDRPYFIEAVQTEDRVTGVYTIGRLTDRRVLPIARRYTDQDGVLQGVVAGYIDLDWLQAAIEERTYTAGSSLTIADRDGRILARTPSPEEFVGTVIPDPFQRLVNAPAPGTEELVSQDGTRRYIGYYPVAAVPSGIYVSAGVSSDEAFAPLRQLALTGILISVIGMAAAFALAAYTSRVFIVHPFERLIETVDAWRKGEVQARSRMTDDDGEIGRFGSALDSFMDELLAARAARLEAEGERRLLAAELNHRIKNLLTLIQAVARQTFANVSAKDAVTTFTKRLQSMAAANDLLLEDQWQAAPLGKVVETSIAPFRDSKNDAFKVHGPHIPVSSGAALSIGMALHELCTNAAKYGALSVQTGIVTITWTVGASDGEDLFMLVWAEHGGPVVTQPKRTGFGSMVIKQVLEQKISGQVELEFSAEGLVCRITAPVHGLMAGSPATSEVLSVRNSA
jgi:two-component sensor histidine kinase